MTRARATEVDLLGTCREGDYACAGPRRRAPLPLLGRAYRRMCVGLCLRLFQRVFASTPTS